MLHGQRKQIKWAVVFPLAKKAMKKTYNTQNALCSLSSNVTPKSCWSRKKVLREHLFAHKNPLAAMMSTWLVPGCKDSQRKWRAGLSYYRLPVKDQQCCRQHLKAVNNPKYRENTAMGCLQNLWVCSKTERKYRSIKWFGQKGPRDFFFNPPEQSAIKYRCRPLGLAQNTMTVSSLSPCTQEQYKSTPLRLKGFCEQTDLV